MKRTIKKLECNVQCDIFSISKSDSKVVLFIENQIWKCSCKCDHGKELHAQQEKIVHVANIDKCYQD